MAQKPSFEKLRQYYYENYKISRGRLVNDTYFQIMRGRAISQIGFILRHLGFQVQKVADIGCGYGQVLEECKKKGIDAFGIEFDPDCVDYCLKRGLKVKLVLEESDIIPIEMVDLVVASHVLEHHREPDTFLSGLKEKTRAIFIEVPKYEIGIKEQFTDQEGHLNFFTKKSLIRLLEKCGYHILQVESCGPTMKYFWKNEWGWLRTFHRLVKRDYFFHAYEMNNPKGIWVRLLATTQR